MVDLGEVEARLGCAFADKSLLHRALVHRSYYNEHPDCALEDNERLEFLGDAVIGFVTGEYLYHRFPELAEGPLTTLRAALIRRDALAQLARRFDLGSFLLMGTGANSDRVRDGPATLCAAFEALIGALYLDQGLDATQRFLEPLIGPAAVLVHEEQSDRDYKSRLQELTQGLARGVPTYTTALEVGPDHAPEFTVQVAIDGEPYGVGTGPNKQQAAQMAAREALTRLEAAAAEIVDTSAGPAAKDPD
jgi:ribonuclease-3